MTATGKFHTIRGIGRSTFSDGLLPVAQKMNHPTQKNSQLNWEKPREKKIARVIEEKNNNKKVELTPRVDTERRLRPRCDPGIKYFPRPLIDFPRRSVITIVFLFLYTRQSSRLVTPFIFNCDLFP